VSKILLKVSLSTDELAMVWILMERYIDEGNERMKEKKLTERLELNINNFH
jgi:hypothetical protein